MYGAIAFVPVFTFFIYLLKWIQSPDDDQVILKSRTCKNLGLFLLVFESYSSKNMELWANIKNNRFVLPAVLCAFQSWRDRVRKWMNQKENVIMVYAMYLSLPFTLYFWFLRSRVVEVVSNKEDQTLDSLIMPSFSTLILCICQFSLLFLALKQFFFSVGKRSSALDELHQQKPMAVGCVCNCCRSSDRTHLFVLLQLPGKIDLLIDYLLVYACNLLWNVKGVFI